MMPAISTTQPADWIAAWRVQAERESLTLSEWIGECCNAFIDGDVAAGLSERQGRGGNEYVDSSGKVKRRK